MARGIDGLTDEITVQVAFCAARGVPVYASLLAGVAARQDILARLRAVWADREFHAPYERPLLLCAALRAAALARPENPLAAAIGEGADGGGPVDPALVLDALRDESIVTTLRERFVQTNEVGRSVAWRLALSTWPGTPNARVHLVDLGCSAGLNLLGDRLEVVAMGEDGKPLDLDTEAVIASRTGLDRAPIDVRDDSSVSWLRACVWPGQSERLKNLDRAILRARSTSIDTRKCRAEDMPDVLSTMASENSTDFVLAYNTVFSAYLLREERAAFSAGMDAWLRRFADRVLWVELEGARVNATGDFPAEIRALRSAPDGPGRTVNVTRLARCDFHTRVLVDVVRL